MLFSHFGKTRFSFSFVGCIGVFYYAITYLSMFLFDFRLLNKISFYFPSGVWEVRSKVGPRGCFQGGTSSSQRGK